MKKDFRFTKTDYNKQTTFTIKLYWLGKISHSGIMYTVCGRPVGYVTIFDNSEYVEFTVYTDYDIIPIDENAVVAVLKKFIPSFEIIEKI